MSGSLTIRQRKILGILNSQKERISGSEIAEYLGVTDRTVRTDLQILAEYLEPYGVTIDGARGKGYLLKNSSPELMQSLVYQEDSLLTPEDRIRSLLTILLESQDPVSLDDVAEEFFVSRSTLEHDLRVISFEYEREQPHIRLLRQKNRVQLEEDEWKRRYVMNLLYVRRWNFNYEAGILMADLPVSDREMAAIEEALTRAQNECGIELTEYDHVCLTFSIAVAIRRIRMGFPIRTYAAAGTEQSMAAVRRTLAEVEAASGVTFSEAERCALSDELAHRQQFGDDLMAGDYWEEKRDSSYAPLIERILGEIDAAFDLMLREDRTLLSELLYILMTQFHNPYHMGMRDEYVTRRVRAEYPDAVEIACRFEEAVRATTGAELTENYLFELAACLAEALETQAARKRGQGVAVTVISHMTLGATKVLMTQLRTFFGARIFLKGPIPVYEATREGCAGADLAVTTTKMRIRDEDIPYLTIPRMMDKQNFERMNCLVSLESYRKLYPGRDRWVTDRIGVCAVADAGRKKERWDILRELLGRLAADGLCGGGFAEAVLRRERQTSTAFREGFALPHAFWGRGEDAAGAAGTVEAECAADDGKAGVPAAPALVCVNFDSPVDWGGIAVDQIFLLITAGQGTADGSESMRLYSCLVYLLRRLKAQKLLGRIRTGDELRAVLAATEKRG